MKTDFPSILCVNPWIHDFAAYDFWAKPLGLLTIAAVLRDQGLNVNYIDCLDRFHPCETKEHKVLWDGRGPYRKTPVKLPCELEEHSKIFSRYGIKPQWFLHDLNRLNQPDLIIVTSLMTYWASGVAETIEIIKSVFPTVPVVLGGIYASLCFDHAKAASGADKVIKGSFEPQLKDLISEFTGFELDDTCLSGSLDDLPFPALDLQTKITYAPIQTSQGCPFSCEYCASSFLDPIYRRRSPDNVFREILHWHEKYGVKNFAFYDDALLVNPRTHAFHLFEKIIDSKKELYFHTPNALHVKAITQTAAGLMYHAGFKNIRLGLETTDFSDRRQHDHKVKEDQFYEAAANLKAAGFKKEQLGAYLLCGLPGQDIDQVEYSMRLVLKAGITPVMAYFTPIPHTPLWDAAVQNSKYDLNAHPMLTNNTLFPCVHSREELNRISRLKNMISLPAKH